MTTQYHAGVFYVGTEAERLASSVRNGSVWYQTDSTTGFYDYYNGWVSRAAAGNFVDESGDTMTGALVIEGSVDTDIQLVVQGAPSQAEPIVAVKDEFGDIYFTIDVLGRIGTGFDGTPAGQLEVSAFTDEIEIYGTVHSSSDNARVILRRSRGDKGSPSAVQSNDILGQYQFGGYGNAYDHDGAVIEAVANQTWTSTAHGTRLVFYTTPDGASAKVEGARLTAGGQWSLPVSGVNGGVLLANELLLYQFGTGVIAYRGSSANSTLYMSPSGSAGSVEFRFYNNNFGTLKGRFLYPDTNPAGHKYVGFINDSGDYLALWTLNGTDILINPSSAETARFTSAALNLASGKVIQVASTQIMTSRRTGWTAASGTATRTTFDTTTVTLEQLAQRVKALIDDFITHGAIGT